MSVGCSSTSKLIVSKDQWFSRFPEPVAKVFYNAFLESWLIHTRVLMATCYEYQSTRGKKQLPDILLRDYLRPTDWPRLKEKIIPGKAAKKYMERIGVVRLT